MTIYPMQADFSRGELSPRLHARVDLAYYKSALAICTNWTILRQGGLRKRPGFKMVKEIKDSTKRVRLLPFVFSTTQAYVLEMGDLYARYFANGGLITTGGGTPTGITKANPAVVTLNAHGFVNGDRVYITGVGGMGVITIGALIGMAAHLDGKGVSALDMTGLAQKYGAVFSHLRIADHPEDIHAARIATGEAHALIGGDLVVSAGTEALSKMLAGKTRAVVSCTETPTAEFTQQRDWQFPQAGLQRRLLETLGEDAVQFIDAQHLASRLMGDALFTNMLLLGYAWQKGLVPISWPALEQAIRLNGSAVDANLEAFLWGRRAAVDPKKVAEIAGPLTGEAKPQDSLEALIARREAHLTAYQDAALAQRYRQRVDAVQALGDPTLTRHVALQYARLLAPKDEYEVARLYTDGDFMRQVNAQFEGDYRLSVHLAPPLFARPGPNGRPRKIRFGPWFWPVLRTLAGLRSLRGSWLDPFRFTAEKAIDRQLLADYEADLDLLLHAARTDANAHALAAWPAAVRGYGPVRQAAADQARDERNALRKALMA